MAGYRMRLPQVRLATGTSEGALVFAAKTLVSAPRRTTDLDGAGAMIRDRTHVYEPESVPRAYLVLKLVSSQVRNTPAQRVCGGICTSVVWCQIDSISVSTGRRKRVLCGAAESTRRHGLVRVCYSVEASGRCVREDFAIHVAIVTRLDVVCLYDNRIDLRESLWGKHCNSALTIETISRTWYTSSGVTMRYGFGNLNGISMRTRRKPNFVL